MRESLIITLSQGLSIRWYIFDDLEKVRFRKMMRKMEAFAGVNGVTYAIMSNYSTCF